MVLFIEATSVWKQPYKQLILGETWNAVAPTGSSWRNWPRGSINFMATSPAILIRESTLREVQVAEVFWVGLVVSVFIPFCCFSIGASVPPNASSITIMFRV